MRTHPQHAAPAGWNAELTPRTPTPALTGTRRCTLAIVGAGYTGIAAARRWAAARPDDDVVLLDADAIGEGSSARNSGFLLPVALADDADAGAVERMEAMNALTAGALEDLLVTADEAGTGLPLGIERVGCYRAAATRRGARAIAGYRRFLAAAGRPCEDLDADALRERLGTTHYHTGLHQQDCVLVQPAALVRALLTTLPASVSLFEGSPVLALRRSDGRWHLQTANGEIDAERVLLANNAWAGRLGFGGGRMTPVYTYAALTPPIGERIDGSDAAWGLLPAARLGTTLRRLRNGRLLVRSGYSYGRELAATQVTDLLRGALLRRWPELADTSLDQVWGGSTGITLGARWVNDCRDDGLMIVGGCNGGGVVKGWLFGDAMARRAVGESPFDVDALFGGAPKMPGEPLRRAGYALLTSLWQLQAGAET